MSLSLSYFLPRHYVSVSARIPSSYFSIHPLAPARCADIILVRMTADATKPLNDQHRYKHCFDGLFRVLKDEGPQQLFRGLGPNLVSFDVPPA